MKIGNTELKHGFLLAPLAGYTDLAFRTVCASFGAEYAVTEMISAKAVMMNNRKTLALARIGALPTAVQLFGAEPEAIAYAAAFFSSEEGAKVCGAVPAAIDLNCGCPMHKIVGNGEGSALLRDLRALERVVSAATAASRLPVTVKIRSGWDAEHINAPEAARVAESAGACAVAVHARTKQQLYLGAADHRVTGAVVRAVKSPVIANGDIRSAADARHIREETGCSAVMIGRGAVGNPWIFAELCADAEGKSFSPPTPEERIAVAVRQLNDMVREKGERTAVGEARKHLAAYIAGFPGAAAARAAINTENSAEGILRILEKLR